MKENTIRYCEVCGRSSEEIRVSYWKQFDKILCSKHYDQLKKYGKIFNRTEKDKNEIVLYNDYAEVIVYSKSKAGDEPKEKARAITDLEDVCKIKDIKWKITPQGYIFNNKIGLLSRFLLNMEDFKINKLEVDHEDNDTLNNRKYNLRKSTSSQQKQNTRKIKDGVNKYKGLIKFKSGWKACIVTNYKKNYSKIFKTEEEAALEYNKMALELFGEFANLNKINLDK